MRHLMFSLSIVLVSFVANAQTYTASQIFAHNDYARDKPFYTAYDLGVGYIEADVFLKDNELMVAHHLREIKPGRTLDSLYLKPMLEMVKKNKGYAYPDPKRKLTIMIDLKTEGAPTLKAVVDRLKEYPQLTNCPTLQFMISGNVPIPTTWRDYPDYIFFDGRPAIRYSEDQLKRVSMISTGFGQHSRWNGSAKLTEDELQKIRVLVDEAHAKKKPFRFWGTPDFPLAWKQLMELNMDVIVTDKVQGLNEYINNMKK